MDNAVILKDNHLYITHEYYDYGRKIGRKIIPVEDIECIKATVGPKGGMHSWSIRGYHAVYSNESYNKGKERDIEIFNGGRKDQYLIEQIQSLLPNCEYHERVEGGGAPW